MPKATANAKDTHRLDLKTLEGGYIIARRLTYGEKQRRMQIAAGQSIETNARNNGRADRVDVVIHNFDIQFYDFSKCIVEHNLTKDDADTQLINFKSIADFEILDDKIGAEIETFLDSINNEDSEQERDEFKSVDDESGSNESVDSGSSRLPTEHLTVSEGVAPQS
jgi:hypothetical protein